MRSSSPKCVVSEKAASGWDERISVSLTLEPEANLIRCFEGGVTCFS